MAANYQCLSLWYSHSIGCDGTSLHFSQKIGEHDWTIKITDIKDVQNDEWKLAEIPLQRGSEDYTVRSVFHLMTNRVTGKTASVRRRKILTLYEHTIYLEFFPSTTSKKCHS